MLIYFIYTTSVFVVAILIRKAIETYAFNCFSTSIYVYFYVFAAMLNSAGEAGEVRYRVRVRVRDKFITRLAAEFSIAP